MEEKEDGDLDFEEEEEDEKTVAEGGSEWEKRAYSQLYFSICHGCYLGSSASSLQTPHVHQSERWLMFRVHAS